ncbi:MAG TPA: polysaccharide deacetylase family protein, partial [Chitinophagales bacterium]|nr:polysaccharide deacetylase family protein [Chitinophagales bacterium]
MYFIRTPFIVKKLFPNIIWEFPSNENSIFLTFDDGPHPQNTHFILAQLDKYNAKATFFCLGENAEKHPELILEILDRG